MFLKKTIIIFYVFCSFTAFGQANNLCGIWFGYNYQCQSINGGSVTFYTVPYEIISITQQGAYTIATKVVGDDCVTNGNVTWEGFDTATTFTATAVVGYPSAPNSSQIIAPIQIIDSAHLLFGMNVNYVKATCIQIDSMSYLFNNENIGCSTCGILIMPNVFTPNNDGINDLFAPILAKNLNNYNLKIYSRWGQEVFSTNDYMLGWNGKIHSENSPEGVYYWICTYTYNSGNTENKKGFLQLIR